MSAVSEVLANNKATGRGSLVGYYPAGYPTLQDSVESLVAMAENGCDVLEVVSSGDSLRLAEGGSDAPQSGKQRHPHVLPEAQ